LKEVTSNDKIQLFYKFTSKNNYKENYSNSLGYFEQPEVLKICFNVLNLISDIRSAKDKSTILTKVTLVKQELLESFKELALKGKLDERIDTKDHYEQIEAIQSIVNGSI
jgi:hypothetical protein